MMGAPQEEEERLAEILRAILDLSGTKRANQSKSTVANESVKLSGTQSGSGIHQGCAVAGEQATEKRSEPEKRN